MGFCTSPTISPPYITTMRSLSASDSSTSLEESRIGRARLALGQQHALHALNRAHIQPARGLHGNRQKKVWPEFHAPKWCAMHVPPESSRTDVSTFGARMEYASFNSRAVSASP